MQRVIVIGDPHGCLEETKQLLDRCQATAQDHVVFVGDLVDRGPDSAGCVDLAMEIEARQGKPACILGNHEQTHVFYQDIERDKGHVDVRVPNHIETRRQLKQRHYDYFRRLPLFIRLPEHGAAVVHAGVFPGRTLEQQTSRHLCHIQMLRTDPGTGAVAEKSIWPSRVPPEEKDAWRFWTNLWDGPERIIFGHSVLDRPLVTDRVVGIDGGACFGRELWAFILPDNVVVSVPGRANHDPGDMDRRSNHARKAYPIHGDVGTF